MSRFYRRALHQQIVTTVERLYSDSCGLEAPERSV